MNIHLFFTKDNFHEDAVFNDFNLEGKLIIQENEYFWEDEKQMISISLKISHRCEFTEINMKSKVQLYVFLMRYAKNTNIFRLTFAY